MVIPGSMFGGILIGALIGCVVGVLILKKTKTDGAIKCKYDERQQTVRGIGFKYGFFTIIIYDLIAGFLTATSEGKQYVDNAVLMLFGIFLGIFVYVSYCIWNDGYFSLNQNKTAVLIAFAVIALANFALAAIEITHGVMIEDGVLTFRCTNLLCGILFILIFLVLVAKSLYKKREEE